MIVKCSSHNRCHHLLKTFCGWLDRQLPDGTIMLDCPGRADLHHPPGKPPFVSEPVPAHRVRECLATVPSAQPNRGLRMPRRRTTRDQDRAKRIEAERARNRQLRENLRGRESSENLGDAWEDAYFPRGRHDQKATIRRFRSERLGSSRWPQTLATSSRSVGLTKSRAAANPVNHPTMRRKRRLG